MPSTEQLHELVLSQLENVSLSRAELHASTLKLAVFPLNTQCSVILRLCRARALYGEHAPPTKEVVDMQDWGQ